MSVRREQEASRGREPIKGIKGIVERTTITGGLLFDSRKKVLDAIGDFTTGRFKSDGTTGQRKFEPGTASRTSAGERLLKEVEAHLNRPVVDPFEVVHEDERPGFPGRSWIHIDEITDHPSIALRSKLLTGEPIPSREESRYVLQIINSDPPSQEGTDPRAVEKGIHEARKDSRQLTLEERLVIPFAIDKGGKFEVDVRKVVNALCEFIPRIGSIATSTLYKEIDPYRDPKTGDIGLEVYNRFVGVPRMVRRWARSDEIGETPDSLFSFVIAGETGLRVDLGLHGIDPSTDNLKSNVGKLSGIVDPESGAQPGFRISIRPEIQDGLPIKYHGRPYMERFVTNVMRIFDQRLYSDTTSAGRAKSSNNLNLL